MSHAEMIEQELCSVKDLAANDSMKECNVKLDETTTVQVLVVKSNNKLSCLAAKCTHYSVPLRMGVLHKGHLRCMAHGACFNVETGDIEDYPGPDCLPKFKIYVKDEMIYIKTTRGELEKSSRLKTNKPVDRTELKTGRILSAESAQTSDRPISIKVSPVRTVSTRCLVIGSGAAGITCVDVLRENGFTDITVLTEDTHLPYDRPKLSKKLDVTLEQCSIRGSGYFDSSKINFKTSEKVESVDFDNKTVRTISGGVYDYDKVVIATGLRANSMSEKLGSELGGVFTLRSLDDAFRIKSYFDELVAGNTTGRQLKVILVGGSFISMETASYFVEKKACTLVMGRSRPFEKAFGEKASAKIIQLHESKGVKFYNDKNFDIKQFIGEKNVKEIELCNGEKYSCDLCLLALGGSACTDFLKGSGIVMTETGLVPVDGCMRTSVKDVYAAGDVTSFPRDCLPGVNVEGGDQMVNIGHWGLAMSQGRSAALAIVNETENRVDEPLKVVPFFWSAQFGKNIRFSGFNDKFDSVVFHESDENSLKFAAFYVFSERVVGVCTLDWDPLCAVFTELLYGGVEVRPEHVEADANDLKKLLV